MATTTTSISYILYQEHRDLYEVKFFGRRIEVAVTSTPWYVTQWINMIESTYRSHLNSHLVVGLDVEWRPNFKPNSPQNPVALIQLCVGHHCLVFQLLYAYKTPMALVDFLTDKNCTFVGVGVDGDIERLWNDYWLPVGKRVDLRFLAANRLGNPQLRNTGLTGLAKEVLKIDHNKPKNITLSNWDNARLSAAQVQYACIDAFLSYEIGRCLVLANG